MIYGILLLTIALIISAVAAFYSIMGLTAIFAAAVTPIIIMGASLEVGKIAATVWIHKYWHKATWQFKLYLVPAIIVLMLITSMGIFGFLSKAHMDQSITVGDSAAQVQILDEKIKTEQDNITASKRALQQMDAQVDQMLGRTDDARGANRAVQIRKQQSKERKSLQADITAAQKTISALQAERAPKAAESRKIEAEVGPIKYIAALIYGDNPDANLLEKAVRWVIILLVLVFDPLALVLILAADQTFEWAREDKKKRRDWHQEWVPGTEMWPKYEPDNGQLTDAEIDEINRQANVQVVGSTTKLFDSEEEFFAHGKEIARTLDGEDRLPDDYASTQAYLKGPVSWFKSTSTEGLIPKPEQDPLDIPVLENEEMWAQRVIDEHARLEQTEKDLANAILLIQEKEQELATIKEQQTTIPNFDLTVADADNVLPEEKSTTAGFGTKFPDNPKRGDVYLRVDMLPNKPYKWNGNKWIELEKSAIDRYVHEEEYVKYLTDKVKSGEYDFTDLTKAEQEEVLKHLDYKTRSDL